MECRLGDLHRSTTIMQVNEYSNDNNVAWLLQLYSQGSIFFKMVVWYIIIWSIIIFKTGAIAAWWIRFFKYKVSYYSQYHSIYVHSWIFIPFFKTMITLDYWKFCEYTIFDGLVLWVVFLDFCKKQKRKKKKFCIALDNMSF